MVLLPSPAFVLTLDFVKGFWHIRPIIQLINNNYSTSHATTKIEQQFVCASF